MTRPRRLTSFALPLAGLLALSGTATAASVRGSAGPDVIVGTPQADIVNAGRGDDVVRGAAGNDTLNGGPGRDVLTGGTGRDVLIGGAGADTINCAGEPDVVYGDSADTLRNCGRATVVSPTQYSETAPITPRLQWDANWGYCGETSMVIAGMRVGQYTSQWTARAMASSITDQTTRASQLLLGPTPPDGNAVTAAAGMRLNMLSYDSDAETSTSDYLAWVKQHFLAGHTVIMGVFLNMPMAGGDAPGDSEYDHIVPVVRVGSQRPLTGANASTYFPSDTLTVSDNEGGNTPDNPAGSTLYTYAFGAVQKTRAQANQGNGAANLYSVLRLPANDAANYAVAVTGVTDNSPGGPFVAPVAVTSSTNSEGIHSQDRMPTAPAGKTMSLTVQVTIPDPSQAYRLYEYTSFAAVPRGSFNTAAAQRPGDVAGQWSIPAGSGPTFTLQVPNANTSGTYVFRAVPVSAP